MVGVDNMKICSKLQQKIMQKSVLDPHSILIQAATSL
jgi:hypothetical protein